MVDFDPADPGNLIYSRPPEDGKIFVSSKMNGGALKAERRAAVEAIEGISHWHAWAWESSAAAGPYYSERECVAQAGTSDGLVLIVEDEITPIVRAGGSAAAWWIAADSRRQTMLREQLQDICGVEAAREIMKLLGGAVDAITRMREQAGEQNSPATLPRDVRPIRPAKAA